jgi:diguanylate cyclase (GGDEF)-like protein
MKNRAWIYIWSMYAVAALLVVQAALSWGHTHPDWTAVEVLFGVAIAAQLFRVEAPNHVLFYATPIFFFAGTILLNPLLLVLLIALPHLAELAKERFVGSAHLRSWYLQPFNIAMFWIAGRAAQALFALFHARAAGGSGWELAVVVLAAVLFVLLNHSMLGIALVLARGVPWAESGILDGASLLSDFVLLCVGSVFAELWLVKPWFVLPALAPVALLYQALTIPKLKREAETDAKTGLYNARHFTCVFEAELERAQRFDRPLAVIMADLDHLREINNAHGHLAGDAVLVGVARTIQATVRDYDVAARFGGEEFALLLPEVDEEQARALGERLRRSIESKSFALSTSALPLRVSMSLGIACFPYDGRTLTELLQAADTAVYAAKNAGRNRVVAAGELPEIERTAGAGPRPMPQAPAAVQAAEKPENLGSGQQDEQRNDGAIRSWVQGAFVTAVTVAGMIALFVGVLTSRGASPAVVGLLTLLGAMAELLEVDLFAQGTVSVSVGIAFTAALLAGIEGLACVSGVIAVVHHLRQRRGVNQLYRALFNWSVHILAGLVVVYAVAVQNLPLQASNLGRLIPTALAAAIGYFAVETGLIAEAVALARGDDLLRTWRAHYKWLLPHYAVLCLMGLALSVTHTELGATGVLIFAFPLLMMHFGQRQYVLQSRENVRTLQHLNRDLMRAALHDHLTGLGNERAFQEALRREVQAAAAQRLPLSLARFNVDELRTVNEESGRRHGDSMLVELAAMLTVTATLHQAFRLVADDFAVILPNTSLSEAIAILDRFRAQVPARLAGATVSVGLSGIEVGDLDADLINEQALRAMSEAKRRGRDTVVSFEAIRENTLVASWAQAQGVRRLLAAKSIDVAFQPIWDIDNGSILGYEALARPGMEFGLVSPQEAFDVATRIGRARELDAVCRAAILKRAPELPLKARLFMNLAPESLEYDGLRATELVEAVKRAGLSPRQVVLELTERSIVRPDAVVRQAHRLREYGFALALDDTGAGNAGLGVLSQLHVDYVKVDRGVVSHAITDQAARAVLAGIFALASEMGAYVIAEGIETVELLELVRDMSETLADAASRGGRGVQGYLLGAPSVTLDGADMGRDPLPLMAAVRLGRTLGSKYPIRSHDFEPMAAGW